jgi:steroid delta-isomerase-like uncharacterized protein
MTDPAAIAREYLESFNKRDWNRIRDLFAPGYSYTGGDGQTQQGPEAGLAVAQMWAGAVSDAKIDIKKIHVAGDTAIVEFQGSGTHDGELAGVPATGRKIVMPVVTILEIKDGRITAEREYMDMAHLLQQLGVMEAPAAATA